MGKVLLIGTLSRVIFLLCLLTNLVASPSRCEFQSEEERLVYYTELPDSNCYPIIILIEGSFDQKLGPTSVLRIHEKLSKTFLESNIGVVTMEKRGIDGKAVDKEMFHAFNTPSQRLEDHIQLVEHLEDSFLPNWNGEFIFLGGSEGGPIAIKLAHKIKPAACVAIVGCSDQPFKELIWDTIQSIQSSIPNGIGWFVNWWYQLPSNREDYDIWCEYIKKNPDPKRWWLGQTFLMLADGLDQTESKEFLSVKCPILVVSGSEDLGCSSTDRLIQKVNENEQDVTYLKIEGMGHDSLDPKWKIIEKIIEFLQNKGL